MDRNEKLFEEQDVPLKNTDRAFVQVRSDGTPGKPQTAEKQQENIKEETEAGQQRKDATTERD